MSLNSEHVKKLPIHTILAIYQRYAQNWSYYLSEGSEHAWNRSLVFMEDRDQRPMPMYIPLYLRNPFGCGRHALPQSAHDLETNSCDPSCAKPNGVRDPAYGGVQPQSICRHMNNIPWFDSPQASCSLPTR